MRKKRTDKRMIARYVVTGGVAGVANGLFGAGGGLFLVPLLISWCRLPQKRAFATALAVMLPLSAVSLAVYWCRGGVNAGLAWPYLAGGIVGGIIGGLLFSRVSVKWLRVGLALFLLYGGIKAVLLL